MSEKSNKQVNPQQDLKKLTEDPVVKILTAAKKLFLQNGYAATTLREIAAEADVALGLIPYYFKNKESLASKVVYMVMGNFRESKLKQIDMSALPEAERTYVINLLLYEEQFSNPAFGPFFFEISGLTDIGFEYYPGFLNSIDRILADYHIERSEHEKRMCLVALAAMEQGFAKTHLKKTLDFNFMEFYDLIFTSFLFSLGIPEGDIHQIQKNAHDFYARCKSKELEQMRSFV